MVCNIYFSALLPDDTLISAGTRHTLDIPGCLARPDTDENPLKETNNRNIQRRLSFFFLGSSNNRDWSYQPIPHTGSISYFLPSLLHTDFLSDRSKAIYEAAQAQDFLRLLYLIASLILPHHKSLRSL